MTEARCSCQSKCTIRYGWAGRGARMPRPRQPLSPLRYLDSSPEVITTDGLPMTELGCKQRQEVRRWPNNRVENSHLSFRRGERPMRRFRQMSCLQKFASVNAEVRYHSL